MRKYTLCIFCILSLFGCGFTNGLKSQNSPKTKRIQGYVIIYMASISDYDPCHKEVIYSIFCRQWDDVEKIIANKKFQIDLIEVQNLGSTLSKNAFIIIPFDDQKLCKENMPKNKEENIRSSFPLNINQITQNVGRTIDNFFIVEKVSFEFIPAKRLVNCGDYSNPRLNNLEKIMIYDNSTVQSLLNSPLLYPCDSIKKHFDCSPKY